MRFPPALRATAVAVVLVGAGVAVGGVGDRPGKDRSKPSEFPGATGPTSRRGEGSCSRVAAPQGEDSAAGTRRDPLRTADRLVESLGPGEVGCLRGGTYHTGSLSLTSHDTSLRSYPGERAKLVGRLTVTGDGASVEGLALDGRNPENLPSPTINADDVRFRSNDVTSPGICFILGSTEQIERPVIERNRIHDCGDPSTNYDHGIYMQNVNEARIRSNVIYDNASRGIKVGPDSQRALIAGNVIDGNAVGLNFSGDSNSTSSHNVVERNVIANSTGRWNVDSYWPGDRVGTGNVVRSNCLHASNADSHYNADGGVSGGGGYTAHGNVVASPRYVDRAAGDFRLRVSSRCLQTLGRGR